MRFLSFLSALLYLLLSAHVASCERKLPADLQVDLIFPRNETYAPTQLFPIVFGVNNLDAVWPLDMRLHVMVESISAQQDEDTPSWTWKDVSLNSGELEKTVGEAPGTHFFHFPAVNMTNGTTDNYKILWDFILPNRCFDNATDPEDDYGGRGWSSSPDGYASRGLRFSTAPEAQLPNIEDTVNSCSEPKEDDSVAVRVTEVRTTYDGDRPCPVLETDVKPAKCVFKSAAKELAADVSEAMLDEMRCEEGTWQTITAPCPDEESMGSIQRAGFGLLALALVVPNIL